MVWSRRYCFTIFWMFYWVTHTLNLGFMVHAFSHFYCSFLSCCYLYFLVWCYSLQSNSLTEIGVAAVWSVHCDTLNWTKPDILGILRLWPVVAQLWTKGWSIHSFCKLLGADWTHFQMGFNGLSLHVIAKTLQLFLYSSFRCNKQENFNELSSTLWLRLI